MNITVPDDLLGRAKAAGLNVSRLAAGALAAELERRAKVAELDAYLAELDAELGPIPQQESVAIREWGGPGATDTLRRRQYCAHGMTVILDAGGVSALAGQRARLVKLRRRGYWPAQVPAVVLTEALSGDHRRDFHANRLLRACQIRDVDEPRAREGARLRTCTGRAGTISATDAIVAAFASTVPDPIVLTSDPHDLDALAEHTARPITVAGA